MSVDPKRVKEIFLGAAELPDEAARAAHLDRACGGDAGLRARVEALLESHDPGGSFLGTPAAVIPDPDHAATRAFSPDADHDGTAGPGDEVPLGFLAPATRPDSLGRIGHYEILRVLGRGGFGIVFRAFDDVLQRVVAVKVLSPHLAATSPARKRFLREAQSSAQVRHENVVQVYEVGEAPLPYLVMEFIPGETLQQRLDRIGPLDVPDVLRIGRQIAEGLAAAHATDLIHRDIKPGNVLLESGTLKVRITDFGLARAADDASISQSGIIAGTPMFMAPEQAKGEHIDHRADLFSLGSVLYAMLAGHPPFRATGTLAVLKRVAEDTPRPIREVIPEAPQWLCDVISKLHAKSPDERFQSAREVADVLADCEAQLREGAKLKDFSRIPKRKPASGRSGRRMWVVAAVLLLPLLALAVTESAGVTHLVREPQRATTDPIKPGDEPTPVLVAKNETPSPPTPPAGTSPWTVLKPIEMKSEGGASLALQPDDSILASGKHPPADSYTLTFRGLPAAIQALRLEVLPHDSLPNQGPGRHERGEFILTTIKAQLESPAKPGEARPLKLTKAWADQSRGEDSREHFAIDADDTTGWVTEVGKPHLAVFELAEPVAVTDGTVLRVTLEFKHPEQPQSELGRFRLSVVEDLTADRKAAEYALSVGGVVKVNDEGKGIRGAPDLPAEPFRLTTVDLGLNKQVTDAGLAAFAGCKNVKLLYLYWCPPITDAGLAHFVGCKGLTQLHLQGAAITDAGLAPFRGSTAFTDLYLTSPLVTDVGLANFKDSKGLIHVHLIGTSVTDAGLAQFSDCKDLIYLDLGQTKIGDAGLPPLKGCKNLAYLRLGETQVTDQGLAQFKEWKQLARLSLDGTRITDAGLAHLAGLNELTELNLTNTKVTAKGVEGLRKALPRCKITWTGGVIEPIDFDRRAAEYVLSTRGNVCADGDKREINAAADLPKIPFRLTSVVLSAAVTDAGLIHFKDCKHLTYINLHDNELVTDAGLAALTGCKNLTGLDLSNAIKVSDAGLAHFKDCKNLQALWLYGTRMTDAGLAHFRDCKDLADVHLGDTKVTDAGLAHLAGLNKLTELNLVNTTVTAKGVEALAKALPRCKITWAGGVIEAKPAGVAEPKPAAPAAPVADTDRKAAEYALSVGGEIKVNEQGPVITAAADLPREAFRLTWVGLPNNKQVTDAGLAAFAGCKNLGGLQLEGTPVTDAGLIHLKDCTGLTGLDLSDTKVTDAGLAAFAGCTKLTYLQLGGTQTTDAGLAHFKDCTNLAHLNLGRTRVGDAGLARLKDRNNLATLCLDGTPVTDAGLAHLAGLDKLIELRLAKTKVTAKGVGGLAAALPKCKITWDGGVIEPK